MTIKLTPLITLIIVIGLMLPNLAYAQVQQSQSSLGIMISSTMKGLSVALKHIKEGTNAYATINRSIILLEQAQKFYNEGNYTGAEYYFKLAMNSSYNGITEAGGKPFSVPVGLNVSRKVALSFAQKLENLVQNVQNYTIKQEAMELIYQAISLLNQQTVNATQAAHNLAQARQLLGNATSILHKYSKEDFGKHFALYIMQHGKFNNKEFVEGMKKLFLQMNFSYMENITAEMHFVNFTPLIITGTIGIYNNTVYFNSSLVIPYLMIGNETFVPMELIVHLGHDHLGRAHHAQKIEHNYEIIGFINSSYAISYISSHKGENITIEVLPFVWLSQSFNKLHAKAQTLNISVPFVPQQFFNMTLFYSNSALPFNLLMGHNVCKIHIIIIILKDVGSYSSAPSGIQIQYAELSN